MKRQDYISWDEYFMGQEVRDRISGNFGTSMGFVALQTFGVTFMYQLINSLIGSGGNFFEGLLFKSFPTMLFTIYRFSI